MTNEVFKTIANEVFKTIKTIYTDNGRNEPVVGGNTSQTDLRDHYDHDDMAFHVFFFNLLLNYLHNVCNMSIGSVLDI